MDSQSNNSVIIAEITNDLAVKSDSQGNLQNTVSDVENVSVTSAVQVPVASLINMSSRGTTTTFDVITSEQLHISNDGALDHSILCVDSSCICENQDDKDDESNQNTQWLQNDNAHILIDENKSSNASSWLQIASLPVLPIRCKNTNAKLYKAKFGSGGRGRCIKHANRWFTPSEFEMFCGRGSSKEWKRSIRFGGRSLNSLIDEGILQLHAVTCTCAVCCDDKKAMGPIRYYIPYKRRKQRNISENGQSNTSGKVNGKGFESNDEGSCDSNNELGHSNKSKVSVHQKTIPSPSENSSPKQDSFVQEDGSGELGSITLAETFNSLDKMASKLVKIVFQLKREVDEAKTQWKTDKMNFKMEFDRDKEQAVLTARVEAQVACSRAVFDSTVHVMDPITAVGLQSSEDSNDCKKCANCNREAFAECSMCRRTPYCSTFCQRKDWSNHQVECQVRASEQGSIMLIVESAPDQVLQVPE